MASLRDQQAYRDAESFDDDRKEGRYDGVFPISPRDIPDLSPASQAALDAAMAPLNRMLSRIDAARAAKLMERAA